LNPVFLSNSPGPADRSIAAFNISFSDIHVLQGRREFILFTKNGKFHRMKGAAANPAFRVWCASLAKEYPL
jgi:hypothetical protein